GAVELVAVEEDDPVPGRHRPHHHAVQVLLRVRPLPGADGVPVPTAALAAEGPAGKGEAVIVLVVDQGDAALAQGDLLHGYDLRVVLRVRGGGGEAVARVGWRVGVAGGGAGGGRGRPRQRPCRPRAPRPRGRPECNTARRTPSRR